MSEHVAVRLKTVRRLHQPHFNALAASAAFLRLHHLSLDAALARLAVAAKRSRMTLVQL